MARRQAVDHMALVKWVCPGCSNTVWALAMAVAHRCKRRKNKMTDYRRQGE